MRETQHREIGSLLAAMKELTLDHGTIVTLEAEEKIKSPGR